MSKPIPFDLSKATELLDEYGSPLYVYDEKGIRENARELKTAFEWAKGYKNYFAVKATPTPIILSILHEEGMGFDCSSKAELEMVKRIGVPGEDIIFTSNNTAKEDFELAIELGATVNIDDLTQVDVFMEALGDKTLRRACVRFNPGNELGGNELIGLPADAKYGMRKDQLPEAYKKMSAANIESFGIHTMVVSNMLESEYFAKTAQLLLDAKELVEEGAGIKIASLNLGGGVGIPYDGEDPFNLKELSDQLQKVLKSTDTDLHTEYGRWVTGPHGYLLTKVRYVMEKHKSYIGVDASMHNLMRPGMYGAYHHITVLGKSDNGSKNYDVVGSLCENNDKFAIDRALPDVEPGDIMVMHDVGAHGHAMGFNYNGLLRSAEVLLKADGTSELMRRAETLDDYFATLVW